MKVVERVTDARAELAVGRQAGWDIGLVPTMGSLHDGHLSLAERAVSDCEFTVMTIFVNPLQFGEGEDLDAYPRDLDADLNMAELAGVDLVFVPSVEEMYPEPPATIVRVDELAAELEAASRPTHFQGVATVVAKLFNIAGPCRAYFGEKDYQQLVIVRRMASDLSFPVQVVGCPIVREDDGLAMSSRNAYLDPTERKAATVLHRALRVGVEAIESGQRSPEAVEAAMADVVAAEPLAELDYAVVRRGRDLAVIDPLSGEIRLLGAVRLGRPRLIDSLGAHVAPSAD